MSDYIGDIHDLPKTLRTQRWPRQRDAFDFYGNPASKTWLADNTVWVPTPWTLNCGIHAIRIHKKCADSLTRVLAHVWEEVDYSQEKINELHYNECDGSYCYRTIRGGDGHHLSMHAFAAAIDWDADDNPQHAQHHLFTDDSLLIKAFKAEGWVWGGDWSPGSIDAMHVQAAIVR